MLSSPREWPRYVVGPRDTIFALGVLALNYNRLEIAFRTLFAAVTETPMQQTTFLFPKIQNDVRLDLIRQSLGVRKLDDEILDRVKHFSAAFSTMAENRNAVMHSHNLGYAAELAGDDRTALHLYKFSRSGAVLECFATLEEVRRAADDMQTYTNFALGLSANVPCPFRLPHMRLPEDGFYHDWPLPDKPPLPVALHFQPRNSDP